MLIGTAWMSRASASTAYALGIALPMIVFGIGQGFCLSTLTTAGISRVAPRDAGVAGGLVNVAHHLGGALCLGVLVTVFDAAGAGAHGPDLLTHRVSASLTAASVLLVLALAVTVVSRPRRSAQTSPSEEDVPLRPATASPGYPAAGLMCAAITRQLPPSRTHVRV
jgi:sugar phosphate permease